MSVNTQIGTVVDEVCPVYPDPGYREKQRQTIIELVKGIRNDDIDVVLLNAPTGSGKSINLYTAMKVVGESSFFTTPLNTLVDQIDNDEFIDDVITLKGRNNYDCIHPDDRGTPVDEAICNRQSGFDCDWRGECEYYGRKSSALG